MRRKAEGVHDGGVAEVRARYVDGVEVPDGAVCAFLAGGGEFDISYLVPVEALMSANVGRLENGEEQARQTPYIFIGGQRSNGADGVVVGALDVR